MPNRILILLALAGTTLCGCQPTGPQSPATAPAGIAVTVVQPSDKDAAESPDEAGLKGFVSRAVLSADAELATMRNRTFVECQEYRRCRYFVPAAAGSKGEESDGSSATPPAGAKRQEWVDRYALAQRYEALYQLVEVSPVTAVDGVPTARVVVSVDETSQRGLAKDESKLADGPEGMTQWRPASALPTPRTPSSNVHRRTLPLPDLPPERGPLENLFTKLPEQAKASMDASRLASGKKTVTFRARWLAQKRLWYIDGGSIDKMTRFVPDWRRIEDLVTPREMDAASKAQP